MRKIQIEKDAVSGERLAVSGAKPQTENRKPYIFSL